MSEKLKVEFVHPTKSDWSYIAGVSPECPARTALDQLQSAATGPFLEKPKTGSSYQLVLQRTQQVLSPSTTMGQAGVVDGDVIQISPSHQGALVIHQSGERGVGNVL